MTPRRLISLWLPPLALMALIFVLSSRSDPLPPLGRGWDKLLHAAAYAVLGLLALRAFHGGGRRRARLRPVLLAVLVSAGYGALDELHQSMVIGRHASAGDLVADAIGVLTAAAAWSLWHRKASATRPDVA